jgi:hypothetical protein
MRLTVVGSGAKWCFLRGGISMPPPRGLGGSAFGSAFCSLLLPAANSCSLLLPLTCANGVSTKAGEWG